MALIPFQNQNKLFLTSGGNSPQLTLWNYEANSFAKSDCTQFNSIHTLAIEPETMTTAAGTRNGLVYIHALAQVETEKIVLKETLIQGSPVLSLCWLGNGQLAVSDKDGRCIIWDIESKSMLQSLETGKNIICSLAYENGSLYGLSMSKRLFSWDINDHKGFTDTEVPLVPKIGSLVSLVFWPENNTLVFPAVDGRLVFHNIDSGELSSMKAHAGSFYSVLLCGKYLASFGVRDRHFKIWSKIDSGPDLVFPVDRAIVSAVCFSSSQDQFLLIDTDGSACEYLLKPQGFRFVQKLQGQNYIISVSLSPSINSHSREEYQKNRAREIANKILKNNAHISERDLGRYYDELTETGYDHVRLTFEINQAEENGNFLKAIELSLKLFGMILRPNKDACLTMEKYACLLEKTWNLVEACRIGREILKIDSSNHCAKKIVSTYEYSRVAAASWIIEPDIPLEIVLRSATLVGNINGRYVIKTLDRIICEKVKLTPELIVKKHEDLQNGKNSDHYYDLIMEKAHFFSRKENNEIQILSFGSNSTSQLIQFAARVICSDSGTVIIPIILFDCRSHTQKTPGNSDNDIAAMFMSIKNCQSASMHLRKIHTLFYHTLQRLITEKTLRRKFSNDLP